MSDIFPGRYTAHTEDPFVVFLIGMRINHLWAIHKWLPVLRALAPMIITLNRHPEKGYLGGYSLAGIRGPVMVQFWRSFQDLERFARSPADPHLAAWQQFNRTLQGDQSVGIFHETYLVGPGQFEAIYGSMPRFGLAQAFEHKPVQRGSSTARERIQPSNAKHPSIEQ
jgi:hypothetical protein